ncbi:MAG: hypothetical protein JXD23_09370 [Spirochaetales bacterium]|nr:hypothetical protein [Spirochaetales bacterium]
MKMSPEDKRASEAMAPGGISREGFFGTDNRPLPDIVQADEEEMRRRGLDFEDVAEMLRRLIKEGGRGFESPVTVDGKWSVTVEEARGLVPCPYRDGCYPKSRVVIVRLDNGLRLLTTDLAVHLCAVHHFLQGRGSPFRMEPELLSQLFA